MGTVGFVINSVFLGVGLAMDAFSVSLANGLKEPRMKNAKRIKIAGVFAGFQYLMPMIGWVLVHTLVEAFSSIQRISRGSHCACWDLSGQKCSSKG